MMPTTMYRSSMFQAPTNSPLVIPLVYETQHNYAYSQFMTVYDANTSWIFVLPRMQDVNRERTDRNRSKAKMRSYRDHNPTWRKN
ncbi:hypothetical protein PVK06_043024 [Gossypium arboreum]|uniref:Uncharacterized protein n=1 Tax=Gossypium arboreum TaxID=29729 RepID=A0ABR0MMT0_GOSAR|nr:hypothetical protein PVK06_043024 [Gossypium arboreum]